MSNGRQTGFTLVEVLVTIAIIGILIGIVLPAVMFVRSQSRRTQCVNNLHQIGIGMSAYHTTVGAFPPTVIWARKGEPLGRGIVAVGVIDRFTVGYSPHEEPDPIHASWVMMLLPYLDQQALYRSFDMTLPVSDERNATARATPLAVFTCPSDFYNSSDNRFARGAQIGIEDNLYARGNYAINGGPDDDCLAPGTEDEPCPNGFHAPGDLITENEQAWGSGAAGVNKSFSASSFTDGMSTTVLVDEIRAGVHKLDPRGVWALGQIGSSATARHGRFGDAGYPNHTNARGEEFMGCTALIDAVGTSKLSAENMPCYKPPVRLIEINAQAVARSLHPGGVHLLMADGRAQFVADEVDKKVWHAMHTRNGEEALE